MCRATTFLCSVRRGAPGELLWGASACVSLPLCVVYASRAWDGCDGRSLETPKRGETPKCGESPKHGETPKHGRERRVSETRRDSETRRVSETRRASETRRDSETRDSETRRVSETRRDSETRRVSETRRDSETRRASETRRDSETRRMSQRASGVWLTGVSYKPGLRQRPSPKAAWLRRFCARRGQVPPWIWGPGKTFSTQGR